MSRSAARPGPRRMSRDDTGSMPLALVIVMVGLAFSTVLATTLIVQTENTRSITQRTRALSAAQAGIDTALAHIRSASAGRDHAENPIGILGRLPCLLDGRVSAAATTSYRVRVTYLTREPQGKPDSWLDDPTNPDRIACADGAGPARTPRYAVLRSEGSDASADGLRVLAQRSLRATYTFRTLTEKIPGGLIHMHQPAGTPYELCLDAGSATPAANTKVRLRYCSPDSVSQIFQYTTNLHLVLKSSKTDVLPLGMCLDAGPFSPSSTEYVEFERCTAPVSRRQQWAFNDNARLEGIDAAGEPTQEVFEAQTPDTEGSYVIIRKAINDHAYDVAQAFFLDANAGAGMAGAATDQVVNYRQFGRCLDVTEWDVNWGYLIVFPCKQRPDGQVGVNQKWTLPEITAPPNGATGAVVTRTLDGLDYCLASPLVPRSRYVGLTACPSRTATSAETTWTRYGENKDKTRSYTIRDSAGYCLSPTDPDADPPDLHTWGVKVSKVVVAKCDGSESQKWNAPPGVSDPTPLKDIGEDLGTG